MYYENKVGLLKNLFGARSLVLEESSVRVDDKVYPIIDDVIVLLPPSQWPTSVRSAVHSIADVKGDDLQEDFATDIQFTFGEEWQRFSTVLDEHEAEFAQYFDVVDIESLSDARVCDLGCGSGRWSQFLFERVKEIVLVDFSEAIFVARRNLRDADNAVFFLGDLQHLPFRDGFAQMVVCLGVLHHLPGDALDEVRALRKFAPKVLVYLYSALDNHPFYFRTLLAAVTVTRNFVCRVRSPRFRAVFSWAGTLFLYLPLILTGALLRPFGLSRYVPLYNFYHGKSLERIRQDVYDRFFTRIEQRFSRNEILALGDTFGSVTVSSQLPYWHFLCEA